MTDLAPKVTAPTLIACARREPGDVFEQSRRLAALIPGSRLVPLDSCNHLLPARDPAWPLFLAELERFWPTCPVDEPGAVGQTSAALTSIDTGTDW